MTSNVSGSKTGAFEQERVGELDVGRPMVTSCDARGEQSPGSEGGDFDPRVGEDSEDDGSSDEVTRVLTLGNDESTLNRACPMSSANMGGTAFPINRPCIRTCP